MILTDLHRRARLDTCAYLCLLSVQPRGFSIADRLSTLIHEKGLSKLPITTMPRLVGIRAGLLQGDDLRHVDRRC